MNCLTRNAVAGEARQPQICRARNDPLLARRQRHEGIARGDDEIHGQQDLAVTADCKTLDRRDPGLLRRRAVDVIGKNLRARDAAQEFVHEAELALDEPDKWNLALIEMRQVDAAAEQAPAGVFRVLDRGAAQHRDVARGIEDRDIDGGLHVVDGGLILGIEKTRIVRDQMNRAAVALDPRRTEIEHAVTLEALQIFARLRPRQQHRMDQMIAGPLMAEHLRKKDSLVDLEPVLVALQRVGFRRDLLG